MPAAPNDAHLALAEYDVPVITMNVDGLHQKARSRHVLAIHGTLPDIVLYDDPAPLYEVAHNWVFQLWEGDFFLIVGTILLHPTFPWQLKREALRRGADVFEIDHDAEHLVRDFLQKSGYSGLYFRAVSRKKSICMKTACGSKNLPQAFSHVLR